MQAGILSKHQLQNLEALKTEDLTKAQIIYTKSVFKDIKIIQNYSPQNNCLCIRLRVFNLHVIIKDKTTCFKV